MNMRTLSPEVAQKRYDALPKEIKVYLYSPELLGAIKGIGEKNKLHVDQVGMLEALVSFAMKGVLETEKFAAALKEGLFVDDLKAVAIAKDVDDMLFSKIREAMKKVYEASKAAAPEAPSAPPAVASAPTIAPATKLPPLSSAAPVTAIQNTLPAKVIPAGAPPAPQKPAAPPPPPMHTADIMLSEKTVTTPTSPKATQDTAPAPGLYKKDPYREPAE